MSVPFHLFDEVLAQRDQWRRTALELAAERDAIKAAAVALLKAVKVDRGGVLSGNAEKTHDALADACGRPDLRWGGE